MEPEETAAPAPAPEPKPEPKPTAGVTMADLAAVDAEVRELREVVEERAEKAAAKTTPAKNAGVFAIALVTVVILAVTGVALVLVQRARGAE